MRDESTPSDGESLLRLLGGEGRRGVAVMQAFLDESGTNPETPVLAVAGCYGEEEQWREFRHYWTPYSKSFHAKDCSPRFSQLAGAMKTSGIKAVLMSVGKDTYKKFATAHLQTAVGNAYSCCTLLCAGRIGACVPKKTAFVLEAGQPNLGAVKNVLEALLDSGECWVGSVASAKKSDFIELQTADFVSHICSSYDKPWMGTLFELDILEHAHLTRETLEEASLKVTALFQVKKALRRAMKKGEIREFDNFDQAMEKILRSDPTAIKVAVDEAIKAHTAERTARGERKRGRKPRIKE